MGRAAVRGVGRGTGWVVFTEGRRPSGLAPPPLRPRAASGTGTPTPQRGRASGSCLFTAGHGVVLQVVCARLCALRCKGGFKCVPALVPLLSRWGVVRRPSTRHLGPPLSSLPPQLQGSHGTVPSLVTHLAHVCGVERPAERPLRNAA